MSVEHYENFPVASWLCPAAIRPAIVAIYHYARTADDIADEGQAATHVRAAQLQRYRALWQQHLAGTSLPTPVSPEEAHWHRVFSALLPVVHRHQLSPALLDDLLVAFEQDLTQNRYRTLDDLLAYCHYSARPIGRLLLTLYGVSTGTAMTQSDQICAALQLINFWQDLSIDLPRDRLYLPEVVLLAHQVDIAATLQGQDSPALRGALKDLCSHAHTMMQAGAPLVFEVARHAGWRAGFELRLVVQGGLRLLEKIERGAYRTIQKRPKLGAFDVPVMVYRAWRMRPPPPSL